MATIRQMVYSNLLAGAGVFAALGAFAAGGVPVVSDLKATSVAPWGVALDYTLSGSTETDDWVPSASLITTDDAGIVTTNVAETLVGDTGSSNGAHRVYWNMAADGLSLDVTNATISVRYMAPNYYVIDLSGGEAARLYSIEPLAELPDGWQTNDLYKTTQLILKRVEASGDENPYYLGVFEVTRRQWELVMGTNTAVSTKLGFMNNVTAGRSNTGTTPAARSAGRGSIGIPTYDELARLRPAVNVTYDEICGSTTVPEPFLKKLRERLVDNSFNLPTAAQWESACRAGTTTAFSYGDAANGDYMWYQANSSGGRNVGGQKKPNAWGFYDMHGNVAEWCLDAVETTTKFVVRGGDYSQEADACGSSASRAQTAWDGSETIGFRLAWPQSADATVSASCTNVSVSVVADGDDMTDGFELRAAPTDETPAVIAVDGESVLDTGSQSLRSHFWQPTVGGEYDLTYTVGEAVLDATYCVWLPVLSGLAVTPMDGFGVQIDYTLDYSPATTNWTPEIVMVSEDKATTNVAKTVLGATDSANGAHSVYWNMSADDLTNDWANVTFEIRYVTSDTNGVASASPALTTAVAELSVVADAGAFVRGTVYNTAGRPCDNSETNGAVVRVYATNGEPFDECTTDAQGCYVFALPAGETYRLWAKHRTNDTWVAESDGVMVGAGAGPELDLDAFAVRVEWDDAVARATPKAHFVSLSAALQCASAASSTPAVTIHRATTLPWSVEVAGACSLAADSDVNAASVAVTCADGASIVVATNGALTVRDVVFKGNVNEGATIAVASNGVLNVTGGTLGLGRVALDPHATFAASRKEADWTLSGDGILLDVGDDRAFEGEVFGTYDKEADAAAVATSNYVGKIVCYNDPTLVGEAKADGTMCWRRDLTRVPTVSAVKVTPVSPWGVAIDYTLANAPTNALYWQPSVCLVTTATNGVATTNVAETLVGATNCVNGAHRVYWNMAADGISSAMTNVTVGVGYPDFAFVTNVTVTVVAEGDDLDVPASFDLVPNGTTSAVLKIGGETVATTNKTGVFTWETEKRGAYYEMSHVVGDAALTATYFVALKKIVVDDGTDGKGGAASTFCYVGHFDNKGHNIDVKVTSPTNTTIKYSFYKYGPYRDTLAITNVCTRTPVWYKISAEGYQDYVSWATVTISEYEYWWCRLAPEGEEAGVDVTKAAKSYSGYLLTSDGTPAGMFQVKASKSKNATTRATVTLQIAGEKKQTLRGTLNVETGVLTVTAKDGRTLSLTLGEDGVTGSFGDYEMDGASDLFASRTAADKALANEILGAWRGLVTVMSDAGSFSLKIQNRGSVRVYGTLTDGTAVSQSTKLIAGDTCNYVGVTIAKKNNNLAFGLWLDNDGENAWATGLGDTAVAGVPGSLADGSSFFVDADAMAELLGDDSYLDLLPDGLAIEQDGTKWVVADEENPSSLKLKYNARSGIVSGSFKAYYGDRNGRRRAKNVKVSGVLVGDAGYAWSTVSGVGAAEAEIAPEDAGRSADDEKSAKSN